MTVNIAVVGLGAFGHKHLDALTQILDAKIQYVAHSKMDIAKEVAAKYGAKAAFTNYSELLAQDDLDGVVLATPTQMHHAQTLEALRAGKHVMVEIPMADSLAGMQEIVDVQKETGLVAMAGHTRRLIRRTNLCTTRSALANSPSSKWMCRPTFSGAPMPTPWATPGPGPTTCCGTMPPTLWTCSNTRPAKKS